MSAALVLSASASATLEPGEAEAIAARLALAYRRAVDFYIREYKLPPGAAHEKANGRWEDCLDMIRQTPPEELHWNDLQGVAETDREMYLTLWEGVKAAAAEALRCGRLAAEAVEDSYGGKPWERAQYIALRSELARGWSPQNGIEQSLIDQMAQAQTLQLRWTALLVQRSEREMDSLSLDKKSGKWEPPRLSRSEAIQEAAGMVDRWNRMFLRNLRALRDMRRYAPVIVNNGGQVNVGQQQVNLARVAPGEE